MNTTIKTSRAFLLCAMMAAVSSCAVHDRVSPVSNKFLEDVDTTAKLKTLPYEHSWVRQGFDGRPYRKLYIKPVRIDLLSEDDWKLSASPIISSKEAYLEEAGEIATHFRSELINKISSYSGNRFEIVDRPGRGVLTMEAALTELEFSHPAARAAALAAPVPGTGAALSAVSDPHAAFAGRLYDENGRLVATVADRKFPPARIVDLNKLTVTSSAREVCSLWADTLSEALNKGRFVTTSDNSRFSLLPW